MHLTRKRFETFANSYSLSGQVCRISVGNTSAASDFYIHEALLRSKSVFFDAALKKCWREGEEGRVLLPEDEATTFGIYQSFLYTQKLPIRQAHEHINLGESENQPEYLELAKLYVFGEKIQDASFKNAVIVAFTKRMWEIEAKRNRLYPMTKVVDIIYKGTMPGSCARKLMVDVHIMSGRPQWITAISDDNNKEFLMDLCRALLERAEAGLTREDEPESVWADYLEET